MSSFCQVISTFVAKAAHLLHTCCTPAIVLKVVSISLLTYITCPPTVETSESLNIVACASFHGLSVAAMYV